MKKLLSVLLVMIMTLAMTTTVFAENEHAHTITINGNSGHNYAAYQIFKGEISGGKLTNIEWGNDVYGDQGVNEQTDGLLATLQKLDAYKDCTDAESVAGVLATFANDSAQIKEFAEIAAGFLNTTKEGSATEVVGQNGKSTYTLPVTGDGYYLIKEATSSMPSGHTGTEYMLKVVSDVSITAKDSIVTSKKEVIDKNDTVDETSGWQKSADYDIGDYIPFKLTATLPSNYESYETYSLTFHDFEEVYGIGEEAGAGLECVLRNSNYPLTVKIDNVELEEEHYQVNLSSNGHCTFEVKIPNMKNTPAKNSSVITVEYYSELTAKANIGALGNKNKMHVTYTNDVYQGGELGKTEDDTVIVFTYQTVVNKVDQTGEALTGAEFTLEKFVKNGAEESWVAIQSVKNTEGTTFSFKGLDDGNYRLVESVVPTGYNKMDDIYFTVAATHAPNGLELTGLTGDVTEGTITFVANTNDGSLTTNVENRLGATLPSTGGFGKTMIYTTGAVLVVGVVILFVTKRRMRSGN